MFHNVEQGTPACAGINTELFFLHPGESATVYRQLKPICDSCPVLEQCRDHALRHELYGFWGGMNADQRQRMRRELGIVLERPEIHFLAS
jgi:WhiB family redox-sensing transcriptional regulator